MEVLNFWIIDDDDDDDDDDDGGDDDDDDDEFCRVDPWKTLDSGIL